MDVAAHVAQNVKRTGGSAIDSRTARHKSYDVSQPKRPLIEKAFGWMKQIGGMRKTKFRGLASNLTVHHDGLRRLICGASRN
jgi:hypothetical protein